MPDELARPFGCLIVGGTQQQHAEFTAPHETTNRSAVSYPLAVALDLERLTRRPDGSVSKPRAVRVSAASHSSSRTADETQHTSASLLRSI
jgi:hypothetical protein